LGKGYLGEQAGSYGCSRCMEPTRSIIQDKIRFSMYRCGKVPIGSLKVFGIPVLWLAPRNCYSPFLAILIRHTPMRGPSIIDVQAHTPLAPIFRRSLSEVTTWFHGSLRIILFAWLAPHALLFAANGSLLWFDILYSWLAL